MAALCLLVTCLHFALLFMSVSVRAVDKFFYEQSLRRLLAEQFNETTSYIPSAEGYPPTQWNIIKGLFSSTIHENIVGRLSYTRNTHRYPDNNFFVSAWIAHMLWEAASYNISSSISHNLDSQMQRAIYEAVETLKIFRNQNTANSDALSISFWHQKYKERADYFCCTQENLKYSLEQIDAYLLLITAEAERAGLNITDVLEIVDQEAIYATHLISEAYGIPGDFDDTSVALALTTLYKENMYGFTDAAQLWLSYDFTSNVQSMLDDLVKYAYRPFSDDINENYIDPRTYYWLRHFLYDVVNDGDIGTETKLMFVPTWQLNHDTNLYNLEHKVCYQEPFSVNNLDPTVAANVVFGITRSLIFFGEDRQTWFDANIQQIYRNTTNVILWVIESGWIEQRPDMIFLYYPSVHDYYWFVSRTYSVFHNYIMRNSLNNDIVDEFPFLLDLYNSMQSILMKQATQQLLSNAKTENGTGYYFWDEFLGNNDLNIEGHPDPHYDDRIFSTAMAVNTLLNVWTDLSVERQGENYVVTAVEWNDGTSYPIKQIQDVIEGAILFLEQESFRGDLRFDNAFFSGSMKTNETGPWYYPCNFFQEKNGTIIPCSEATMDNVSPGFSIGISGFVDNATYQNMIDRGAVHGAVPDTFYGYNIEGQPWPYWSSHAVTHSASLLAVAKYDRIGN